MTRVLLNLCFVFVFATMLVVDSNSYAGGRNLLVNPGFEENGGSYDGWFTFGDGVQLSLPAGDDIIRTGAAASKIYGEFTACPVPLFDVGGYGQAFTPTPGRVYKFTGYSFISVEDTIPGTDTCNTNRCIAKVVFFDAAVGGAEISSNEVIIGDGNTATNEWIRFGVASAPAPVGAMRVEALILFLQPGCDEGSVFVDDTWLSELESVSEPNILVNPSFDNDLSGWTTFGNALYDGRTFAHRTTPGSAKMFGTFVGGSDSGMFQSFPSEPGKFWKLDVFALTTCFEDPISGTNDNKGVAAIVFSDALGEIASSSVEILDNMSPLGTWMRTGLIAEAPPGTIKVEAYILFIQPSLLGGALWVDDVSFSEIGNPTGIGDETPTMAFELHQNVPNPFNPTTRIDFNLMLADEVNISVYDVKGRLVTTLLEGRLGPGPHNVTWNGKSASGAVVAAGTYWYMLKTSTGQMSRSMVLVK